METIFGQPSFTLSDSSVSLAITKLGGEMAPVQFSLAKRKVQPFAIAPWWNDKESLSPLLKAMRGDFFCMPFGANEDPYNGEQHPAHGETANASWMLIDELDSSVRSMLHLRVKTTIRPALVDKIIEIRKGHSAVYQRHVISGGKGPMCLGHHATLRFNSEGLISTSPIVHGEVSKAFESPAKGGYSCLKPGATFTSLAKVPRLDGTTADLSRYPAREGFEDIAILCNKKGGEFAWSAVVFPHEGYVWISLKDPGMLAATLLWHSNGGRHYAPWNGRHRAVLGIEEITGNFHYGLAESVKKNALNRKGIPTTLTLSPTKPTIINYIMAAADVPRTFAHVKSIEPTGKEEVRITDVKGKSVKLAVDWEFLQSGK